MRHQNKTFATLILSSILLLPLSAFSIQTEQAPEGGPQWSCQQRQVAFCQTLKHEVTGTSLTQIAGGALQTRAKHCSHQRYSTAGDTILTKIKILDEQGGPLAFGTHYIVARYPIDDWNCKTSNRAELTIASDAEECQVKAEELTGVFPSSDCSTEPSETSEP